MKTKKIVTSIFALVLALTLGFNINAETITKKSYYANGNIKTKVSKTYNKKDNLTKYVKYNYNSVGLWTKQTVVNYRGNAKATKKNKKITSRNNYAENKTKYVYKYSKKDKIAKRTKYTYSYGSLKNKYVKKYNKKGKAITKYKLVKKYKIKKNKSVSLKFQKATGNGAIYKKINGVNTLTVDNFNKAVTLDFAYINAKGKEMKVHTQNGASNVNKKGKFKFAKTGTYKLKMQRTNYKAKSITVKVVKTNPAKAPVTDEYKDYRIIYGQKKIAPKRLDKSNPNDVKLIFVSQEKNDYYGIEEVSVKYSTNLFNNKIYDVDQKIRERFLELINADRVKLGRAKVVLKEELNIGANARAKEMENDTAPHIRANGTNYYTIYDELAIIVDFVHMGENLHYGWNETNFTTLAATKFYNSWKNSEGHYYAMMLADQKYIGFGFIAEYQKNDGCYTENGVLHFAR